MNIDMHYYGVYALARAAGLTANAAETIAYASQFVDESVEGEHVKLDDGSRVVSEVTSHHPSQAVLNYVNRELLDHNDDAQRLIWVPFHFLPGNEGNGFTERLVCRKDSKIAQEMIASHIDHAGADYGLELLGIAAHVYADTFAHYGFSGVSSRKNEVEGESFEFPNGKDPLEQKYKDTFLGKFGRLLGLGNIRAGLADVVEMTTGALGHGAVFTYPDTPYLHWRYQHTETSELVERRNFEDYVEACQKLHARFTAFASHCDAAHRDTNSARGFAEIEAEIRSILALDDPSEIRVSRWQKAVGDGTLFSGTESQIPAFNEMKWLNQIEDLNSRDSNHARRSNVYRFYQAARIHRTFVLRDLLPRHGLVVI